MCGRCVGRFFARFDVHRTARRGDSTMIAWWFGRDSKQCKLQLCSFKASSVCKYYICTEWRSRRQRYYLMNDRRMGSFSIRCSFPNVLTLHVQGVFSHLIALRCSLPVTGLCVTCRFVSTRKNRCSRCGFDSVSAHGIPFPSNDWSL